MTGQKKKYHGLVPLGVSLKFQPAAVEYPCLPGFNATTATAYASLEPRKKIAGSAAGVSLRYHLILVGAQGWR
jgi:hypothetical protein